MSDEENAEAKKLGRPPKSEMQKRFGVKPGEQVPLHVANQMAREANEQNREREREAAVAAAQAVENVLGGGHQGRRVQKNLRAPVVPEENADE